MNVRVGFTPDHIKDQEHMKRLYALSGGKMKGVCPEGHRIKGANVFRRRGEMKEHCRKCVEAGVIRFDPEPRPIQTVYFIADGHGNVKIGIAANVPARLDNLQTANASELTLLATVQGGREMETELHAMFGEHHVRGEWFRLAPAILEYIEPLKPKPRKVPDYVIAQREAAARQATA